MATDRKYGDILADNGWVSNGVSLNASEDEPVFVIRAQDSLSLEAVEHYRDLAETSGAPPEFLSAVQEVVSDIGKWQNEHPDRVKMPD